MYGKLVDGELQYAPKEFTESGRKIVGFTDDFLRARGYKPVRFTAYPIEDTPQQISAEDEYVPRYTDMGDEIVQEWVQQ